jgi:hypothetical protein
MQTLKGRVLECGTHDCVESPKMGRQIYREPASPSLMEQLQSNGTIEEHQN